MTTVAAPSTSALDPALFTPEAIDPETTAMNAQLSSLLAGVPAIWTQPASVTREVRESGRGPFGPLVLSDMAQARTIPGPSGPLTIRTFIPQTISGIYLHFHGGGWTLGGAHHSDMNLEGIAKTAQVAVLSVEYRLAPEYPYPAGPDDCEAAAVWLVNNAQSEFGTTRLLIGGESAGAHLSVATLIRLRDKHGLQSFSRANLTFGAYDLASTPSAAGRSAETALVLSRQSMDWFYEQFVPATVSRRDPDVSPLWAELHGLPAALFSVGTLDPLLDDSLFMHARWIAAGNPAELAIYPGGVHGFTSYEYTLARTARARIIDFLKK
jgi:acetyl esterase